MRRRRRAYTAGIGTAAAFLAGCLSGSPPRTPENPPAPPDPANLTSLPVPSSYHAHVVDPPAPNPQPLEQVVFPSQPQPPQVVAPPEAPRPPDSPLVQALRYVLEGKPGAAAEVLQRCDPVTRDALLALLQLAAPLCEGGLERASPQQSATALEQINRLQSALRRRAPLAIEKMCFCREVRDFGKYYPLPPDYAFQTGSDGLPGELVQVYVEVRNVICRQRGLVYETALKGHVEIHDFRGNCVWSHDFDNRPDRSRTPLQDNYVEFHFNVPSQLLADSAYTLWVYVKDVEDDGIVKVVRRSLDFRVRQPYRGGPDPASLDRSAADQSGQAGTSIGVH
jgi:hypothetical protein